ncbi:MAG TPA: CapA family protein [Ignavibacteriales bacterium]|nr:CapA family protein [Ignavibacteriales bacterium]
MQLIIGADLVPTKSNYELFNKGDVLSLLGEELLLLWNEAEIRIFNLEVPLYDKKDPIDKCGPNLIAPTSAIKGIKALNPSLITLANNHILDQGEQGLFSTLQILKQNHIPFLGAGKDLSEASKPYIINKEGIKIGIYACTEHEFSIATDESAGANPFDSMETLDHIQDLKDNCDYVIVLYHGGKEHYRYPSPYLQKVCRKMAQKGADLILCQHSHCIGCYEEYEGSTIVYGQGNFLFDHSDSDYWQTSLLVKIDINNRFDIEYIPIVKVDNCVRLATNQRATEILGDFYKRSSDILKKDFVEQQYLQFAKKNINSYLYKLSGFNKLLSGIDRKLLNGMIIRKIFNKEKLLAIQNYIECEAHRELLLQGIKKELKS